MAFEGFDDLVAFAAVADKGSFKSAAKELGRDASVISRRLSQLEQRLGVRLLARNTRNVQLTEAGTFYVRRIRSILDELDLAGREVSNFSATPQGILKLSLPMTFGRIVISPMIPNFLRMYPQIKLDAHFLDRRVDVVREGFDVVIRLGIIQDSSLIARKLGSFRTILVASPSYLSQRGLPKLPTDLTAHDCIGFTNHIGWPMWALERGEHRADVRPEGPLVSNSSETVLLAALDGMGIALVPTWMAEAPLESGELLHVMPEWQSIHDVPVQAVMPPGSLVPAKVRAFLDEVIRSMRADDIWQSK